MAMAATNQPLPGLSVTAPDEDMEISDYERNADDIDIDIDLSVDPSHHEDENMDDERSEHGSRDDVMLDGDGNDDEDGMMQDNMSVPDEHLSDASDVGYVDIEVKEAPQDQSAAEHVDVEVQDSGQAEDYIDYDDTASVQTQSAPQAPQQAVDHSAIEQHQLPDSEKSSNQEPAVQTQSAEASTVPQPSAEDQVSVPVEAAVDETISVNSHVEGSVAVSSGAVQTAEEPHIPKISVEAPSETISTQPALDSHAVAVTEDETHLPTEVSETHNQAEGSSREVHNDKVENAPEFPEQQAEPGQSGQQPEEALDFSHLPYDSKHDAETQSTHTGGSLHPVVVVYQGDEISLFPPSGSDTSDSFYFLHDESLANESIRSLLQACRQVLGETMRDEDELEIDIAELGLCVSEDSENSVNTSFAQILDVYLQLHQLDGHHNPSPLYMTLNTKTRFSARLDALLAAIADGRGISQLSFLEDVTEEDAYTGSDHAQEEQDSVNQGGEQYEEHDDKSIPEHASEYGNPQVEASYEQLNVKDDHQPESDSTAVPQNQTQAEDISNAASQEQWPEAQPNKEAASTHEHEAQGYVSPAPEDLPEYDSSDEVEGSGAQGNDDSLKEGATAGAPGSVHSQENDQISYDDGENAEEIKDDASLRSSTLQGDNTPAAVEEGMHQRERDIDIASTGIVDAPHDEPQSERAENRLATRQDDSLHQGASDTQAPGPDVVDGKNEATPSVHQDGLENAEETLEQELERELNEERESFDLHDGSQELPDEEEYPPNYEAGEEHGYEHGGGIEETQDGEGAYEGFVVEETKEADQNLDAPDDRQAVDDQSWSRGDGFDDAEADEAAENEPDGAHSGLEQDLDDDHAGQAQPNAHASDEDELDTIDYDDEELSRPQSAQQDEVVAPSPSSGKRGWEELGQDGEDQANEQAPKKVKSE